MTTTPEDLSQLEKGLLISLVEGWMLDNYHKHGVALQRLIDLGLIDTPKVYVPTAKGVELARELESRYGLQSGLAGV